MARKRISPYIPLKSKKMTPIAYLAASLIRNFADFLSLSFIILASKANYNGLDAPSTLLLHLAIGFAFAGFVFSLRKSRSDIILASFGSLLSLGFLSIPLFTGFFPDPIFLGFAMGLGRNFWNSSLLLATNQNKTLARSIDNAGMLLTTLLLPLSIFAATNILPAPDQAIFPLFSMLCIAQACSLFCTGAFYLICNHESPESLPENAKIYPSTWRDDLIPLIARSLISGVILGLCYLFIIEANGFVSDSKHLALIAISSFVGILFFYIINHPLRTIGSAPWGLFLSGASLMFFVFYPTNILPMTMLASLGIANVLACCRRACRPEDLLSTPPAMLLFNFAPWFFAIGFGSLFYQLKLTPMLAGILLVLTGIILTWVTLRAFLEQLLSIALILPYKMTTHGPGIEQMPYRGPVIIIANHASYLDPFLIGKVVTRRIIPMMTSVFYDLPVIYWLMSKVVKAIRVEAATFRREAPELNDAIEALKRGELLLIFPEARLRKKEDQLLFPFGQGIWHILNQLPETPIVPIWVEGVWGSYASYYKGDPFANKSMDFLRKIKVVAGEARVVPKELLAEHRLTRKYLQEVVLENRNILGFAARNAEQNEDLVKD